MVLCAIRLRNTGGSVSSAVYILAKPVSPPARADMTQTPYVAYFCMEFGLHESFPIYAGGLGVLAGDFIKSAHDLDLPVVAVT